MLASQIARKYQNEKCAVLAIDDGGAMVGAQIASAIHCPLMLLSSAEIMLPREPQALAGITGGGQMTYNRSYSDGEIDELVSEYYGLIEQEKLTEMHMLNHMTGMGETTKRELLTENQKFYSELIYYSRMRGYKEGWAAHKYKERFGAFPRGLHRNPLATTAKTSGWIKSKNIAWAKSKANK